FGADDTASASTLCVPNSAESRSRRRRNSSAATRHLLRENQRPLGKSFGRPVIPALNLILGRRDERTDALHHSRLVRRHAVLTDVPQDSLDLGLAPFQVPGNAPPFLFRIDRLQVR